MVFSLSEGESYTTLFTTLRTLIFHPMICYSFARLIRHSPVEDTALCITNIHCLVVPEVHANHTQGYKTFFMLNSTEHEISTAHKNLNTDK